MVYLALLEFIDDSHAEPHSGHFTFVAEAASVAEAAETIKRRLRRLKARGTLLAGIKSLSVRSIVEMSKVPGDGVIAFMQSWPGQQMIHACDFPIEAAGCRVYTPPAQPGADPETLESVKPFIVFDS